MCGENLSAEKSSDQAETPLFLLSEKILFTLTNQTLAKSHHLARDLRLLKFRRIILFLVPLSVPIIKIDEKENSHSRLLEVQAIPIK